MYRLSRGSARALGSVRPRAYSARRASNLVEKKSKPVHSQPVNDWFRMYGPGNTRGVLAGIAGLVMQSKELGIEIVLGSAYAVSEMNALMGFAETGLR